MSSSWDRLGMSSSLNELGHREQPSVSGSYVPLLHGFQVAKPIRIAERKKFDRLKLAHPRDRSRRNRSAHR
jgi:hypothetical protein